MVSSGTIYKITSPSGKGYVGQTVQPLWKRMYGHKMSGKCFAMAAAVRKYGWHRMVVEELLCNVPLDKLDEKEAAMIAMHGTLTPNGYNIKKVECMPYKAKVYASVKDAVRAFNDANPEAQRVKQNGSAINVQRRATWETKRMEKIAEAVRTGNTKRARHIVMSAKASAKLVAKNAALRCAGTGRDPMQEWRDHWGGRTIDSVIAEALEMFTI